MSVLSLTRRDPAFRLIKVGALLGAGLPLGLSKLVGVFGGMHAYGDAVIGSMAVGALLGLAAPFLLLTGPLTRASEFEMGLPVSARALWRSRIGLLIALAVITLAGLAMSLALVDARGLGSPWVALCGHLAPALVLLIACVQALDVNLPQVRMSLRLVGAAALGVASISVVLVLHSPLASLVVLAVAVAVLARTDRALPMAFTLASEGAGGEHRDRGRTLAPDAALRRMLLRHTVTHGAPAVFLGFIAFLAFFAQVRGEHSDPSSVIMPIVMCGGLATLAMHVLRKLGPLPVPRRRLFAYFAIPGLLAIGLGAIGGETASRVFGSRDDVVRLRRAETKSTRSGEEDRRAENEPHEHRLEAGSKHSNTYERIVIPASQWRVAYDGEPPAVELPSGERFVPYRHPIGWDGAVAYNPYDTAPNSTDAFVAHQLSRALKAVHGVDFRPAWIEAEILSEPPPTPLSREALKRELAHVDAVLAELKANGSSRRLRQLVKDHRQGDERSAGEKLAALLAEERFFGSPYSLAPFASSVSARTAGKMIGLLLVWGVWFGLLFRFSGPVVTRRGARFRMAALIFGGIALLAFWGGALALGATDPDALAFIHARVLQGVTAWAPNPLVAWAGVAALAVLVYKVVGRAFEHCEVPTSLKNDVLERWFRRM